MKPLELLEHFIVISIATAEGHPLSKHYQLPFILQKKIFDISTVNLAIILEIIAQAQDL